MQLSRTLFLAFTAYALAQSGGSGGSSSPTSGDEEGVQWPKETPRPNADTSQGCFSSAVSDWESTSVTGELSVGSCNEKCRDDGYEVAALDIDTCYCGSSYPPEDDEVDDEYCNHGCPGFPQEACGGYKGSDVWYSVFNTGVKINVPYEDPDDDEDSSSSTTGTAESTATQSDSNDAPDASGTDAPAQEEEEEDDDEDDDDSSGVNVGGIAGGVAGGVAAIALVGGLVFWWFRRRRNHDMEEEHRRNAAVNSFIAGAKPPSSSGGLSMTDSRMDPGLAQRRMSDGSIADNQDYSRKILRVTNA